MMKIAMGCDHAAFDRKNEVAGYLKDLGYEIVDCGTYSTDSVDYPDIAAKVCEQVTGGQCERGILVCGTGIGMSIAANKHKGIRAACCSDTFSARLTRMHNDANVLCIGARVVGAGLALDLVDIFAKTDFEGGRHEIRVNMLKEFEK